MRTRLARLSPPRQCPRGLWGTLAAVAVTALVLLAPAPAAAQSSQTWNVDCSVPDLLTTFQAANAATGDSSITINLAAGCTYLFTAPSTGSYAGESAVALVSPASAITINGNGATLERSTASGTPYFRLLTIGDSAAHSGAATVSDLTLENGVATGSYLTSAAGIPGPSGGGLESNENHLALNGDTLLDNSTIEPGAAYQGPGGGVESIGGTTVTDSQFIGNTAGGSEGDGGGGLDAQFVHYVSASTFVDNSATWGGGLMLDAPNGFYPYVTNSTFVGNSASVSGGAIGTANGADSFQFHNDTIDGNSAPRGSALGGGDVPFSAVYTSIVDGSCSSEGGPNYLGGAGYDLFSSSDSCVRSDSSSTNLIGVSSFGLGPLESNGGPVQTQAVGPGSPAYQFVPIADCPLTDARGVPLPQPAGGAFCSAGAYEAQAVPTALTYTGPTATIVGTPVRLAATLTQPAAAIGLLALPGGGVSGQSVTITLGSQSCTAQTNSSGQASCQITPNGAAGSSVAVSASYAGGPDGVGDDYYVGSASATETFSLSASPPQSGVGPVGPASGPTPTLAHPRARTTLKVAPATFTDLAATLRSARRHAPLRRRIVVFSVAGHRVCTARTNAHGSARCTSPRALALAAMHLGYTVTYMGSRTDARSRARGSALGLARLLWRADRQAHIARIPTRAGLERYLKRRGPRALERLIGSLRHQRARRRHRRTRVIRAPAQARRW